MRDCSCRRDILIKGVALGGKIGREKERMDWDGCFCFRGSRERARERRRSRKWACVEKKGKKRKKSPAKSESHISTFLLETSLSEPPLFLSFQRRCPSPGQCRRHCEEEDSLSPPRRRLRPRTRRARQQTISPFPPTLDRLDGNALLAAANSPSPPRSSASTDPPPRGRPR